MIVSLPKSESPMSVIDAIYARRAVRSYVPQPVDKATIRILLDAAVHAPTAVHEEPWAFAIIQDKKLLNRLSDFTKELVGKEAHSHLPEQRGHGFNLVKEPDFNVFYNAGTLIVIYGKPLGAFVGADCWLAAENLMLAACSMGLGTCVIGFAVAALNTPEWKKKLSVSAELTAYAPVIVGIPSGETSSVPRKQPEIIVEL
jgi:nitroreductase